MAMPCVIEITQGAPMLLHIHVALFFCFVSACVRPSLKQMKGGMPLSKITAASLDDTGYVVDATMVSLLSVLLLVSLRGFLLTPAKTVAQQ